MASLSLWCNHQDCGGIVKEARRVVIVDSALLISLLSRLSTIRGEARCMLRRRRPVVLELEESLDSTIRLALLSFACLAWRACHSRYEKHHSSTKARLSDLKEIRTAIAV